MPPQHPPPVDAVDTQELHETVQPEDEKLLNRAVYASTKYETCPTWHESLCGALYIAWILLCPLLDMIWVIIPTQLIRVVVGTRLAWPQYVLKWLEEMFYSMLGGLLEIAGNMQFVITTDDEDTAKTLSFAPQEQVLLLCNHRTEIDWIFFWNLAIRFNCHGRIRVMMKSIIRCLPGPGWAMLMLDYPYVSRKWETDQGRIKDQLAGYNQAAIGYWLCMFPEGTALYHKTLERSHAFAKERGEKRWDYVLIPRVRGFELCVQEMEPDCVLDVTVGYPELQDGIRPSPLRLLRGQFPTAVHVHLTKYTKNEVAKHKDTMDQWLKNRFQAKEDRLRQFYTDGAFKGHRMTASQTNIGVAVAKGIVFHSLLCLWTLVSWYYVPYVTLGWFSLCMAMVIHRIHAFGN